MPRILVALFAGMLFGYEPVPVDLRAVGSRRRRGGPLLQDSSPPTSETEAVYFVNAWAQRRNAARAKSFEKGHTITDPGIADSLSGWGNPE